MIKKVKLYVYLKIITLKVVCAYSEKYAFILTQF